METRLVGISILLLLLVGSVHASSESTLNRFFGEAASIEIDGGEVEGEFIGLVTMNYGDGPLAPTEFLLQGENIHMEVDKGMAIGDTAVVTAPELDEESLDNYIIRGSDNRVEHSLIVIGDEKESKLSMVVDCDTAIPSSYSLIRPELYVDSTREYPFAEATQTTQWSKCEGGPNLHISGNFVVSLWEWDIKVESPDGTNKTHASGEFPLEGQAGALYPHATQRQQIWLFVEDGDLKLPYWENSLLFLDDVIGEINHVQMDQPTGNLRIGEEEISIDGDRMELSGDFVFDVQGKQESLAAQATGQFSRVQIDGEDLAWTTNPEDSRAGGFSILALIALVATAMLLVAGTVAWYTSPKLRSAVLDPIERRRDVIFEEALAEATLHNVGRPRKGKKWVRLAMRLRPNHPEALAAMGTLLFHMKKYRKALGYFQKAIVNMHTIHRPNDVPDDAVAFWAVECARCLAGMRLIGPWEKREELSEEIMDYAHMAAKVDPGVAELLLTDKYISDLWNPIRMAVSKEDYGVKP